MDDVIECSMAKMATLTPLTTEFMSGERVYLSTRVMAGLFIYFIFYF